LVQEVLAQQVMVLVAQAVQIPYLVQSHLQAAAAVRVEVHLLARVVLVVQVVARHI
tara:strand:+ start:213 stop:380 length:168 start_codon:yes stop_codon:yes gene_type:complete